MNKNIEQPHSLKIDALKTKFAVPSVEGLTESEAKKRLEVYGENRIKEKKTKNPFLLFLEQFLDPVVYVLLVASVLAFAFSEWIEGFAILVVILINATIGFILEWQAIRSMEALRKMAATTTKVRRYGEVKEIESRFLVPGDVIVLEMGEVVGADARIIKHENLAVKEAALTGESTQVEKNTELLNPDTHLADRKNMVFKGTLVTRGTADALVTATAEDTELGKISQMTKAATQESTPLEKRLHRLSMRLIWLTLFLAVAIAIVGYVQGRELKIMIETAIALAIAAIPEGLPIVATIALARGMIRLSKKRVIVKKLEAVQTLGETSVICTDKTGTLTENQMTVKRIWLKNQEIDIEKKGQEVKPPLDILIKIGVLCNNAESDQKTNTITGDPLEMALLNLAEKKDFNFEKIRATHPEVTEIPFDTEKKIMGTLNEAENGYLICAKGALESILKRSTHLQDGKTIIKFDNKDECTNKANEIARQGLRTLGFAYRKTDQKPNSENFMQDLVFLGVAGFEDPPRADVKAAMKTTQSAGIKVVMVTGDHPETAKNIAVQVGLVDEKAKENVVHGDDLGPAENWSEKRKKELLETAIFARVTPVQKLDLIKLYQDHQYIVGMTGDGVNDTPALKKADIGIAMGERGTEAAKEVADVILKDDSFAAIELAIKQGRVIFENIRKFVVYLLSSNLAEIIVVGIASLVSLPLPLLPLQILYLNLVTDVFPALALGMNEGEKDIMEEPPRNPKEPIMPRFLWISTLVYGLGITVAVMGITAYAHLQLELPKEQVNNMAFYTLVLSQLLNVFNLPKRKTSFFNNEVTKNPWVWGAIVLCIILTGLGYLIPKLREVLSLVALDWSHMGLVILFSFGSLVVTQIVKRLGGTV